MAQPPLELPDISQTLANWFAPPSQSNDVDSKSKKKQ